MLYDAKGYEKIYIAPGYTDMRKSIDGLKLIIGRDLKLNPYQKNVLFLFCGRNSSKIKALVWEGDGFVLLYKRIEDGRYNWPRTPGEVLDLAAVSSAEKKQNILLVWIQFQITPYDQLKPVY